MENFKLSMNGPYRYYSYVPWEQEGIVHGFIDKSGDFSDSNRSVEDVRFCEYFRVAQLFLPIQTHSATVLQPRLETTCSADAIVIDENDRGGFGIRTADCLPIIVRTGSTFGIVHAGWRGLAGRIIHRTLERLNSTEGIEALIGPCAGPARYEVGEEVISGIGEGVVAEPLGEKFLLNLQETAKNQILQFASSAKVMSLPICTIRDENFHSHRRQGVLRGSNLAFIAQ